MNKLTYQRARQAGLDAARAYLLALLEAKYNQGAPLSDDLFAVGVDSMRQWPDRLLRERIRLEAGLRHQAAETVPS